MFSSDIILLLLAALNLVLTISYLCSISQYLVFIQNTTLGENQHHQLFTYSKNLTHALFFENYTNLTYNWLGPAIELHCTQVHASRHKGISIRNCNLVYAWGKTYETWVQIQTFPLSHDGFGLLSIRQSIVRLQVLCDFSAHFEPVWTLSSICQPLTTTGQSWK